MSKKNIIIISIAVILVIIGIVCFFIMSKDNAESENTKKIAKLYEKLIYTEAYTFCVEINENNKFEMVKENDKAYLRTVNSGEEEQFIIRDGNTYLLVADDKEYYTYPNNAVDLTKITDYLSKILEKETVLGEEKINNKNYKYEEYADFAEFSISNIEDENVNTKTKFYFNGNNLEYIKTTIGDKEEFAKVSISYKADENLFEIPAEYEKK